MGGPEMYACPTIKSTVFTVKIILSYIRFVYTGLFERLLWFQNEWTPPTKKAVRHSILNYLIMSICIRGKEQEEVKTLKLALLIYCH